MKKLRNISIIIFLNIFYSCNENNTLKILEIQIHYNSYLNHGKERTAFVLTTPDSIHLLKNVKDFLLLEKNDTISLKKTAIFRDFKKENNSYVLLINSIKSSNNLFSYYKNNKEYLKHLYGLLLIEGEKTQKALLSPNTAIIYYLNGIKISIDTIDNFMLNIPPNDTGYLNSWKDN